MTKKRITETTEGIQNFFDVKEYDLMMQNMKGERIRTIRKMRENGMKKGKALEIGPGPGYLGIEWLLETEETSLQALEISLNMIEMSKKNSKKNGLENRTEYCLGNAMKMPFSDNSFDFVFSNGSLHEWEDPIKIFCEIRRVLKSGGIFFISDLRRDAPWFARKIMYLYVKPKTMRPGLITSLNAAYTPTEIERIVKKAGCLDFRIEKNPFGLEIIGKKS